MYQNLYKNKPPKPHPLTVMKNDRSSKQVYLCNNSLSGSFTNLKKIKDRAVPGKDFVFESAMLLSNLKAKKTVIKSKPDIKNLLRKLIRDHNTQKIQGTSSFFYANIMIPKKKLPELYSKGFFIGSEKFVNEDTKHSSSKSLSFVNNYLNYN